MLTNHIPFADIICKTIEDAAQVRGTGIAKRKPAYVATKMQNGNAVIALQNGKFAGFCYIEKWGHGKFVANSGLIVHPDFRNLGLAKQTIPVENTRNISKKDMIFNNFCPDISVDPETYEVKANGEILTCEPATELPLAQRYFLF